MTDKLIEKSRKLIHDLENQGFFLASHAIEDLCEACESLVKQNEHLVTALLHRGVITGDQSTYTEEQKRLANRVMEIVNDPIPPGTSVEYLGKSE